MEESYLISQERCPECAKVGKDRSGNNLAIYSDGHVHCFSCGYHVFPSGVSRFNSTHRNKELANEPTHSEIYLPTDCDVNYPARALEWVGHYGVTRNDLLNNNVLWSDSSRRLIFPVFGDSGLIAYQGRYFGESVDKKIPKWYGKGDLKKTFHFIGKSNTQLVLVEDIISAIKLGKFTMAMPLFGSHIGTIRFKRLYSLLKDKVEVCIYLDYDKAKHAIKEARIGNLCGLKTRVVLHKLDPKEVSLEELKILLAKK